VDRLLPPEALARVFHLLPPRDLRAVVLVCRRWREVGEAPALWAWLRLLANQDNLDCMPEVLASRRLRALRRIEVWEVSEELLQAVIKHPELKVMELDADLSSLYPELLAQVVTQLEEVELSNGQVTTQQADAICTAILGNSRLKRLELTNLDLSSVEAPIMAQAVTELEELSLCNTRLTSQQVVAIFSAIDSATKLRILKIRHLNLSVVDADLVARAVIRLETVWLHSTGLTGQQVARILGQSRASTSLKELVLCGYGGGEDVDEELLKLASKVIPKLKLDSYK